ncbi:MAG: YcxB family protein [Defluviitaleaceae bacterium]|nr:YcxB family protein [Defluviitaleaceae bacterium]
MFSFECEVNDNDYLEFNLYSARFSPDGGKKPNLDRWVVPIIYLLIAYLIATVVKYPISIVFYLIFGYISIYWIINYKKMRIKTAKKRLAKMSSYGKLYEKKVTMKFDDDKFYDFSEYEETQSQYYRLERIVVDNNAIYLYVGVLKAYIIPKRVFTSEEEQAKFLEFINSKIPEKPKKQIYTKKN